MRFKKISNYIFIIHYFQDKEKDLLVEEILVSKESMLDSLLPVSDECSLEKEKQLKPCDMLASIFCTSTNFVINIIQQIHACL